MNAIFEDTFLLTIILIVLSTLIIAFIKRVHIDKSLKGFRDDFVNVIRHDKSMLRGKLDVKNTGLELLYKVDSDDQNHSELSYIIYKAEYPAVAYIARYAKDMNAKNAKRRLKAMKRAYHPNIFRKIGRGINNFFRTIKDALMDIFTQLSGKITSMSGNTAVTQSSSYTTKINQELVNTMDTSYDPILEKYIGNVVVAEVKQGEELFKVTGVLKEYTAKYYELWDVDLPGDNDTERCDILLPTATSRVRHVGEQVPKFNLKELSFDVKGYDRHLKKLTSRKTLKKRNKDGRLGE
jgi:hypothetical protein